MVQGAGDVTLPPVTFPHLPPFVTTFADWDKFKEVFINLFDTKLSLFADRYKVFQTEWLGPAHESFQEYVARIRQTVALMDGSNFSSNEISTLLLLMGMKMPILEPLQSLVLNALIKTPTETLANPETNRANVVKKAGQKNKPQRGSTPVYDINRRKTNVKPKAAHGQSPGTMVSPAVLQTSVNNRQKGAAPDAPRSRCPGCDGAHWKKDCPYKNSKCYACEGLGHIAKVCPNGGRKNDAAAAQNSSGERRSRKNVRSVNVNSVKIWEPPRSSNGSGSGKKDESRYGTKVSLVKIYSLRTQAAARRRFIVPVMIADKSLYFDFDSGSDVTVISRRDYQVFGSPAMAPARIEAHTASNSKMVFDGYFKMSVICSNIAKSMDIYVSDISCSVLGLDFCDGCTRQSHPTGHDSIIAQVSSPPTEVTVAAPTSATAIESSVAKLKQVAAAPATTSPQEMAPVMYVAQQKFPAADIPNVAAEHTSVITHARISITIAAASSNAHQSKDAVDATPTSQTDQLFVDTDASSEGYCNTTDVTAQPYADVAQPRNTSDVTAQLSPCEPAASHLIAASRLFNANDPVSWYLKKNGRRPRKAAIVGAHVNAEQYRLADTVFEKKKKNRPPDVQKKKARK
uniref:CCHC-type domain-containing protein n=1 Tax=Panagrolaimus davidi TaxID=227884 RepID=A0A914PUE3_9BILA